MAELRTITIRETFEIDGVLTDLDSVPAFTAENASYSGVIRNQDDAVVVAADTTLTKSATGTYTYSFTESPNSYTYTYWIKWIYSSTTYYDEHTISGGSAALTTKTAFKNYAGITITTDDDLIDALLNRATAAIESYCDRKFQYDTYRERYDGDGTCELILEHPLLVSTVNRCEWSIEAEDATQRTHGCIIPSQLIRIRDGDPDKVLDKCCEQTTAKGEVPCCDGPTWCHLVELLGGRKPADR